MTKTISFFKPVLAFSLALILLLAVQTSRSQTLCITPGGSSDQITGVQDGYRYELWNQNAQGTACMTLGEGALFSGEWDGIFNYLARRGLGYNQTQEHQEVGSFYATFDCDYQPSSASGNSYLSIYGWTVDPLIEYYIVEDWRNWIPSMANGVSRKGSFTVNGSVYDIYENTRTNQPSIVGTATFQQYFSIRRDERTSGIINISDHFEQWESLGMNLGKLHEVSFVVEGFQSNGSFEFTELDVFVSDEPILGVEGKPSLTPLTVFPNPGSGKVAIQINESISEASITIYDTSGKPVFAREHLKESRIEVTNLKRGIYLVKVTNTGQNHSMKLVIQ